VAGFGSRANLVKVQPLALAYPDNKRRSLF
jgi:hypothetical protein